MRIRLNHTLTMALCNSRKTAAYDLMSKVRLNHMPLFSSSKSLQKMVGKQYSLIETRSPEMGTIVEGEK